jgi:hypothetical protein
MLSVVLPGLLMVTVWAALVVLTGWLAKVSVVGERLTAGATPVPVRLTACGLPLALSAMLIAPVRVPVVVGVNVTLIVQTAPPATDVPQVFVWVKSPLVATVVIVNVWLPVFVRLTVCIALTIPTSWLEKERLVGERLTAGNVAPVPVRPTLWGLPLALSAITTAAVRDSTAVGAKTALIWQLDPADKLEPHVVVSAKSPAFVPLSVMLLIVSVELPVLESVIVCAGLVVPTN